MEGKSLLPCDVRYHDLHMRHMLCRVAIYLREWSCFIKSTSVT